MNAGSSRTAALVAAWRALGDCLPDELRLCQDSWGWHFAPPIVARLRPVVRRFPKLTGRLLLATPLRRLLLWLQLRTRAIDDIVTDFMGQGGAQLVLLGAGFDSRAIRMAILSGRSVFEVDHPATQARKRAIMQAHSLETSARFVPWDFERDRLEELPSALQARGLDPGRPTVTVWEGVIPYLSEAAVAATLAAVRRFGSGDSRVVLHYVDCSHVGRLRSHRIAAHLGEPMRFGWEPSELPSWLHARGFALMNDRSDGDLARQFFPERWSRRFRAAGGRLAIARPL